MPDAKADGAMAAPPCYTIFAPDGAPRRSGVFSSFVSRSELFLGLLLVGFANGISEKAYLQIKNDGFLESLLNTFDVSAILWFAFAVAIWLLRRVDDRHPPGRMDLAIALLAATAFLLPVPQLSWVALGGMGLYLCLRAVSGSAEARAGAVMLALTIPPFWARIVFAAMSDWILRFDALLVGWVVGTSPVGNVVPLAGGEGSLFVAPACSSIGNVSLALLATVTFINLHGAAWSRRTLFWAAASCLSVIAINVLRIAAIGFYPDRYDLIHGAPGATVAGWLTVGAILAICFHGIGRHEPHSA